MRMPKINRSNWLMHRVPNGTFGRIARLGPAAQGMLLLLLGSSAVLLELF